MLVLSLSVFSSGTPAVADPAKKPAAAKSQTGTKAAAAKQSATSKNARTKTATVKRQARSTVRAATPEVASIQSGVPEMRVNMPDAPQMRANTAQARVETTGTAGHQPSRMPRLFASSDPVEEARRWIGTNPTDMNRAWCARFMNFVLERSGYSGTGSDAAKSFASYGRRVSGPRVGAIAVMTRGKNGGHVGIVSGIDERGNVVVISGNSIGRKVAEASYPRSRIYAYVLPQ
jgi:uncharacterized protein (TIGR02594 family)